MSIDSLPSSIKVLMGTLRIRTQILIYLNKIMKLLLGTQTKKTKKNEISKQWKLS